MVENLEEIKTDQDVADESKVESEETPDYVIEYDESEKGELDDDNTFIEPEDKTDGEKTADTVNEDGDKNSEDVDLDKIDKKDKTENAFKKKQFQLQQTRDEKDVLQKKNDELQAQINKSKKTTRPVVPPVPEAYDADYTQKITERDQAIADQIAYDNNVKSQENQALYNQQQMVLKRHADLKESQQTFRKRSDDFGIKESDLDRTEAFLNTYITPQNAPTVEFMLKHKEGPLIMTYLSENPEDLEKVANMAPVDASAFIVTEIAPKAAGLKPTKTNTPKPVDTLETKKAPKMQDKALDGVTFE